MESGRRKIMLVDDAMDNLTMGKNMLKDTYEVYAIPSAGKLFEILKHVTPDLVLLDVLMPQMDGYETIRLLKSDPKLVDIPVIFLTSKNDEFSELQGLSLGAIDYVVKPFSAPLLLKRIENHLLITAQKKELKKYNDTLQEMVHQKTVQVFELQNAVLSTVSEMLEFRDTMTGGHILRTQNYLQLLVDKLLEQKIYLEEVLPWDLDFLIPSAQLHDVGRIAISDAILKKPGKLTFEEYEEMKKHVTLGVEAVEKIMEKTSERAFLRHAKIICGTHHEKWDGTGYPAGLKEKEIPLEGRLMAIADVYDALISERPYKGPYTSAQAEAIIREGRGKHFDPTLVDMFQQLAEGFAEVAKRYC